MRTRLLLLFALPSILLIGLYLKAHPTTQQLANGAQLHYVPCWFSVPTNRIVQCAHLYPAKQLNADTLSLRLPVVILRQQWWWWLLPQAQLLYLSGGPGGDSALAADSIEYWWEWLDTHQWSTDLVLFEQRGTGISQPRLRCPDFREADLQLLAQALDFETEMRFYQQQLQHCYQQLRAQNIDLSQFNTLNSASDAHDLMQLLDNRQGWHLYGISYGTRLAMTVQRLYPQQLNSVILDGAYPPVVNDLLTVPMIFNGALQRLLNGCQNDALCQQHYPDLAAQLDALLAQLAAEPLILQVDGWDGELYQVVITPERLLAILFQSMYWWETLEQLPALIA